MKNNEITASVFAKGREKENFHAKTFGKNRQASLESDWERGRVAGVHRERFELWTQAGSVHARMKRGLRLSGQDMPTVGDVVFFSGGSGATG